jgi:hypothetical protein
MSRACLNPGELVDALLDVLTDDEAKRHLVGCPMCDRRLSVLRRLAAAGPDEIAEAADEVNGLVARLYSTPRHRWWRTLQEPEYHRPDVVQRLATLADASGLSDKNLSVALIEAATRLVTGLPDDVPSIGDLRFEVWKLACALLREAGRYEDTERALESAAQASLEASDPVTAEAYVLFYRALLFSEPDVWRPTEAAELLDRVEPVFHRTEARRQALLTARATLVYREGDFRNAFALYQAIFTATPETDRKSRLNHLSNVLMARVDLGEADAEVQQQLSFLIDENATLGRDVQVARARWLMGRVRRSLGEYENSESFLRAAMSGIGDCDSAIRVGLDLMETLLLDERYDAALLLARHLATDATALDKREPSRRRTLTAEVMAYAREAAQRGALTADLVSTLSRYVDRINRQRATDFIPPMPLAHM